MNLSFCRVCSQPLYTEPLLRYRNMPAAAQEFPDAGTLGLDAGADLDILQCCGCGLVQLAVEPVPYYREVIRSSAVSPVLCDAKHRQFSAFIERHGLQGKKIIEVGCGRGEFLSILHKLPVEAYGIEYSEKSVLCCRDSGLRVSQGYPDAMSADITGAPFHAFFLLMFLEHMPDPNVSLRAISRQLAPMAVGLIEVPNFDMMVRNRLFSEFIADHLMYFSQETLEITLRLNGFEVLGTEELRDDYVISMTVRKREPIDLSEFLHCQEEIFRQLRDFIARFPSGRIAVWGAGHQALAILSLAGIADTICYVVDSAPFKQGKFTPVTHIPIMAPAELEKEPVDAVIVMAGGYSREVADILLRNHGKSLSISVLSEEGFQTL